MEAEFLGLMRTLAGRDARRADGAGEGVPGVLANHLAPHLAAFRRREPRIRLEIGVDNSPVDLDRREADIVLRASRGPQPHLVGTRVEANRVGRLRGAVAAATHRRRRRPTVDRLREEPRRPASRAVDARARPGGAHRAQDGLVGRGGGLRRAGLGAACLWCLAGDRDRQLVRLTPPLPDVASDLWLLTHPDLRRSERVGRVRSFLARTLRTARNRLEGKRR